MNPIKVGLIGFGRMGGFYLEEMQKSGNWDIVYICDVSPASRELAQRLSPRSKVISDEQIIFNDPEIQAVGLFALADSRPEQIQKAIASGKHVIAEKPIADTVEKEWQTVALAEKAKIFSTVNLYLRNSWYHNTIKDFIAQGEIGELAIIRVCHMTPGLAPGEGHEFEGPSFHDCGMHYVDIARWYAESEFKTWNAQAIRMWDYKDPWWLQCHGTFENGIVFDITQGHVYGQLAEKQTHNSYIDIIGTKGIARMTHDFKTAIVELHGVTQTHRLIQPYGGKTSTCCANCSPSRSKAGNAIRRSPRSATPPRHRNTHGGFSRIRGSTTCRQSEIWKRCRRSANAAARCQMATDC